MEVVRKKPRFWAFRGGGQGSGEETERMTQTLAFSGLAARWPDAEKIEASGMGSGEPVGKALWGGQRKWAAHLIGHFLSACE